MSMYLCICATLCPCIVQIYVHVLCNLMSMYCATLCPYIVQPSVDPIIVQLYVHVLCNFMSMYCATLCPCIVQLHVHVLCNLMSMCSELGKDRPRLETGHNRWLFSTFTLGLGHRSNRTNNPNPSGFSHIYILERSFCLLLYTITMIQHYSRCVIRQLLWLRFINTTCVVLTRFLTCHISPRTMRQLPNKLRSR